MQMQVHAPLPVRVLTHVYVHVLTGCEAGAGAWNVTQLRGFELIAQE